MQIAAREVAWENTRLRELLAIKRVSIREIELFLGEENRNAKPTPAIAASNISPLLATAAHSRAATRPTVSTISNCSDTNSKAHANVSMKKYSIPSVTKGTDGFSKAQIIDLPAPELGKRDELHARALRSEPSFSEPFGVMDRNKSESNCHPWDPTIQSDSDTCGFLPLLPECIFPSDLSNTNVENDNKLLEMSCETAADIIAGMRGNVDRARTKQNLGCGEGKHCNIRNTRVLQVMEMD
ncbi:hypothetical protein MMC25_002410 [Agyrium rufum]|nr:hypothetical protein [Agyrium rufum]